jgi:hypothetical protein
MIYKFSLLSQKVDRTPAYPVNIRSPKPGAERQIRAGLSCHGTEPFVDYYSTHGYKHISSFGNPRSGFCALRMANKQILEETTTLLHIPEITLTLNDDLAMKLCSDKKILYFIRQEWVMYNLTTVQLQFLWDGNPAFPYRGDQTIKMYPSVSVILLRRLCYALNLAKGYLQNNWELDFRPRYDLRPMAKVFTKCPNLKRVQLWSNSDAFFEVWNSPIGDMVSLAPLVRKGVIVELLTPDGVSSHLGQTRAFQKMREGWGIWAWLRLKVFRRGLRWEMVKTVYDRDDGYGGDCVRYFRLRTSNGQALL